MLVQPVPHCPNKILMRTETFPLKTFRSAPLIKKEDSLKCTHVQQGSFFMYFNVHWKQASGVSMPQAFSLGRRHRTLELSVLSATCKTKLKKIQEASWFRQGEDGRFPRQGNGERTGRGNLWIS